MFLPALAFCGGAACLFLLARPGAAAAPVLAGLALLCAWRHRATAAAALCGLAFAIHAAAPRLAADWSCRRDREAVRLEGRVATPALRREGRVDFDLDAERPRPMRVRIAWYEASAVPLPGERWRVEARLRCRRGMANPGAPDRELLLLRQGIAATGYALGDPPPLRLAPAADRGRMQASRARLASHIEAAVASGPSAAVLQGLSTGLRGQVPDALWDAFAATGVAHLMAISGVHVTGCALAVLGLMRGLRRVPGVAGLRGWSGIEAWAVVLATGAYAVFSGASEPALRTLAMVAVAVACRALRRELPLPELLAVAAVALLALDPLSLAAPGFWLSFAATAALVAVAGAGTGWWARIAGFLRAQAAVFLILAPVLAFSFGRVSLVAPLANAMAIPVFGLVLLPAVLLASALDFASAEAAAPLWRLMGAGLDRVWPALEAMARWPLAELSPAQPPPWLVAACGLAALAAILVPATGPRLAASALVLALVQGARPAIEEGAWRLTAFDVGQGLAVLVETRRHALLFDTGPAWRGGGAAASVSVLPSLRARGIRRLDALVVSHPDQDHAGGVAALRRALPLGRRFGTADRDDEARDAGCRLGERWHWDGVSLRVLHPPAGFDGSDNDRSCAIRVEGASASALLLADPEAGAEALLLAQPVAADVVLLPHHGSRSSSTPALVAAVRARIGIASAGYGNRWGMPRGEILARWRGAGTSVLTTADRGAVTVHAPARGGPLIVETQRDGARRWWRRPPGG